MRKIMLIIASGLLLLPLTAQVNSDGWALIDALGRKSPGYGEVREHRPEKIVAMFYWTWHTDHNLKEPRIGNISKILRQFPEAANDADHPAWNIGGNAYFWEEPLFGYYRTTDKWVLRRHAEMLADAGVDVVFFDCTNGSLVWKSSYDVLMECWNEAARDGVNVPKIAFMLPFGPVPATYKSLRFLYEDIYQQNRYPDLWFMWEGKPLIMAYDEAIPADGNPLNDELRSFFTFRPGQPDYVDGPADNRQWGWMEIFPQQRYGVREDGTCEQAVVSVAQNTNRANGGHCYAFNAPGSFSRSYTHANGHDTRPDAYLYGLNFQEQWEQAMRIDPDVVFVTGWNEFIAGKHAKWPPKNPYKPFAFPDQYDWDRSRDIEPVKVWGEFADVYYCQLVSQVRRFKGMDKPEKASGTKTIDLANFGDWDDVLPEYRHYRGNVFERDHPGYADTYYRNTTGRNDIVTAKVARDKENLYFFVETAEQMTDPLSSPHWMMLFIDIDRNKETGWEGYDFVLNRSVADQKTTHLEHTSQGWNWSISAPVEYVLQHNKLALKIPRHLLGLGETDPIDLEFKWNDHMQELGNPIDFYVNGDTAPGGRFNFVYRTR